MPEPRMFTYQTRPVWGVGTVAWLDAYAQLYGRAERSLFAALLSGNTHINALKREFLPRFALTARQFNALRIGLQGKIDSIVALRKERRASLAQQIKHAGTVIARLEQHAPGSAKPHQKRRRLGIRCYPSHTARQRGNMQKKSSPT